MAWRRHNRHKTHEVFYDGTTIDGSRLESAMDAIEDGVNNVKKGDTKQRHVAVQYHSGWYPIPKTAAASIQTNRAPWLGTRNTFISGTSPDGAPFSRTRFKGISVPGIEAPGGAGSQYAWTRMMYFSKPVVLHAFSVLMHVDNPSSGSPFVGSRDISNANPYTYDGTAGTGSSGGDPPTGFSETSNTVDVPIVIDVLSFENSANAELTEIEVIKTRYPVNLMNPTPIAPSMTMASTLGTMSPAFESGSAHASTGGQRSRPLQGRLMEHRDLNIPIPENSTVRMIVCLPKYDGTQTTKGSWGTHPYFLQGWSSTLTVLEEVESI